MKSRWWRRNWLWLVLLIPLAAGALAASSQRYINVYLPWKTSAEIPANAQGVVDFHQRFKGVELEHERSATLKLLEVSPVDQAGDEAAAPGGQLWLVKLQISAKPDQVLNTCNVALLADGTQYGFDAAKRPATDDAFAMPSMFPQCVPEEAPGPSFGIYSDEIINDGPSRPESWEAEFSFVVPEDVTPDEFRIWWQTPEYASFPLKLDA